MILVDANVLLYAEDSLSPYHDTAREQNNIGKSFKNCLRRGRQ